PSPATREKGTRASFPRESFSRLAGEGAGRRMRASAARPCKPHPTKKPACAGSFVSDVATASGQRADVRGQAALVAGGLVLVDQAARGVAIHHGFRGF